MEELNNRQMVLLTMFASFVVSVATGIITVAMLQAAPETVTQTVNRVVEHTIERIVAGTSTPDRTTSPTVVTNNVTKEVTVYAKEDDLVVAAVEKNQPRIATIYAAGTATSTDPITIGFVVSHDGLIVTDSKQLLGDAVAKESYTIRIAGKEYSAQPVDGQDGGKQAVFFLKLKGISASSTLDSVTYGRAGDPKLAQSVIVLGGVDGSGVFKTSLSHMRYAKLESTTTASQILTGIESSPKIPDQNLGALVVNLDGQVIGIVIPDGIESSKNLIYPVSRILESASGVSK
jgi:hypothetical protein